MKKLLRYLIFTLVGILVLAVVFMAISPKNMTFKANETIEAPPHMIYNMVNDFKQWEEWSTAKDLDPDIVNTYSDNTTGDGAQWTWKGNEKVGAGTREIIESLVGKSIKTEIVFEGWDAVSNEEWEISQDGKKTKVSWEYRGADTSFPFRPFNILMKGGYKKTYKNSLAKLKEIAEQRASKKIYRGFKINDLILKEKHYLMSRQEVKLTNIQQFYAQNLGALFLKAQNAKLIMDGMPSGLFFNLDEKSSVMDMAAAIPIAEPKNIERASLLTIPEGRALQIDFFGDYSGTTSAHLAIEDYIKDYGLFKNQPVVEEYVTDPGEEKDPSKWLTKISYYISEN